LANFLESYFTKYSLGLLYGVLLTNARAMGEFGAVAVVSGKYYWENFYPAYFCGTNLSKLSNRSGF
jgi:ABC-type sulfate transport system permease component